MYGSYFQDDDEFSGLRRQPRKTAGMPDDPYGEIPGPDNTSSLAGQPMPPKPDPPMMSRSMAGQAPVMPQMAESGPSPTATPGMTPAPAQDWANTPRAASAGGGQPSKMRRGLAIAADIAAGAFGNGGGLIGNAARAASTALRRPPRRRDGQELADYGMRRRPFDRTGGPAPAPQGDPGTISRRFPGVWS